jgi:hypothetical protein
MVAQLSNIAQFCDDLAFVIAGRRSAQNAADRRCGVDPITASLQLRVKSSIRPCRRAASRAKWFNQGRRAPRSTRHPYDLAVLWDAPTMDQLVIPLK